MRIAVLALWVTWAALGWWTAPRPSHVEQARADLTAGRVVAYEWGDSWDTDVGWAGVMAVSELQSNGTYGPLFAWRTPDWRVHYVDVAADGTSTVLAGTVDATQFSDAFTASLAEAVQAAGGEELQASVGTPFALRLLTGPLLTAAFLVLLLAGPAPRIGTRWFWFWVATLAPLGLGLLTWLIREHPRPAEPDLEARPDAPVMWPGRETRLRGPLGFGAGLVAAFAGSFLLHLVSGVTGEWLVPIPY